MEILDFKYFLRPLEITENFDPISFIRIYLSSVLTVYHRLFVDNESLSSLMEQNMLKRYVVLLELVTCLAPTNKPLHMEIAIIVMISNSMKKLFPRD